MSIFDQMKSKAQSQLKTAARSAMQNLGNQKETFTFAPCPRAWIKCEPFPRRRWIPPLRRRR